MGDKRPRVVIVGGGFAGLELAKKLRRAPVDVFVVDRRNHHLFQPLLYQVATASLSPADIAWPIRHVLSHQKNVRVLLAEAVRVDADRRELVLKDGELAYDVLCLCTGVSHSYFGHGEWEPLAPGLKTIEDATEIRRRFLLAFEAAERETDDAARRAHLTFVIVGGGPTGVELAGAMAEIARRAMPADFRSIDTATARIVLVEGEDRILPAMPESLSERARRDLEKLGVEVLLRKRVTAIDAHGVKVGDERIDARCVLWAAGVAAEKSLTSGLGVALDNSGRVPVEKNLTVPDRPEVFVLGDLAVVNMDERHAERGGTPKTVPGIAPAAMQMGRHAARVIAARARGHPLRDERFRYLDKGLLATIGRARAVAVIRGIKFGGFVAWALWAGVHIFYLIGARSRIMVVIAWAWEWALFQRGARLITGPVEDVDK
jgi:NADH dehydrogenase